MIEELLEAGLSEKEAKVYEALLTIGMSTAKGIIEKTGLHRQTVYHHLDKLINKGLVSYVIKANVKHFKAEDPKQILNFFEEQKEAIEKKEDEFKEIIPKLENLRERSSPAKDVSLYRGKKGLKTLFDYQLDQEDTIYTIGTVDNDTEAFRHHRRNTFPEFNEEREKKGIPFKMVVTETRRGRANQLNPLENTEVRILPDKFKSNVTTFIYGETTVITMWGDEPFAVLIKSPAIAKAQMKHFNLLWEMAEKPEK